MLKLTRKHSIAAAHRLFDYTGKCERLHGHNYIIEITLLADNLDSLGMIMDFGTVKSELLNPLDTIWDHRTLLYDKDPLCNDLQEILSDGSVCAVPFNPTAENMAQYLGETFFPEQLRRIECNNITVVRVAVFETENNSAVWERK